MADRKRKFKDFERYITLCLSVATIVFIAFLIASGTGNIPMKIIYALVAIAICGYCLWLLYQKNELLRRRSFWMSVWAGAVIICCLASLILNFPSPNLHG